jgi:hypothetical protein
MTTTTSSAAERWPIFKLSRASSVDLSTPSISPLLLCSCRFAVAAAVAKGTPLN